MSTTRPSLAGVLSRLRSTDALFGAMATAFGLVSLAYPFGRDQGLLFYTAREWLRHGQVPYRDVWAVQPPVIYVIHLLTIALLGAHVWSIRVVELLVAVPLTGWVAARLATPRGEPLARGVFGAAWLGASVVHYGYFNFWDTAQCEIWYALFAVGGLACVLRAQRAPIGHVAGGALSALALLTKPVAAPFVVLTLVAIVVRSRSTGSASRDLERGMSGFVLGALGAAALVLGVLAIPGALTHMFGQLFGATAIYGKFTASLGEPDALPATTDLFVWMSPFSGALLLVTAAAAALGWSRSDGPLMRRYGLPVALAAATSASVWLQGKFYPYHWGPLVAPAALFFALLWQDCARVAAPRAVGWAAPGAFAAFVAGLFLFSGQPAHRWYRVADDTLAFLRGRMSPEDFARRFDLPGLYSNHDAVAAGLWLRRNASPDDTVVVRGFEPEIYAVSGLRFTGRFYWTTFLTFPGVPPPWLGEDRDAIAHKQPRFAVALNYTPMGIDSPGFFEQLGYERRVDLGGFTILDRVKSERPTEEPTPADTATAEPEAQDAAPAPVDAGVADSPRDAHRRRSE